MRTATLLAISTVLLASASAFGQGTTDAPITLAATTHPAKPAVAVSTPESRSAAALALSHEPTFDEGTAQRIKEAARSEEHTSELQSHRDLHSFPTRRSSDLGRRRIHARVAFRGRAGVIARADLRRGHRATDQGSR